MKKILVLMLGFLLIAVNLYAAADLTVNNLRVEGTQAIGFGTTLDRYKPININQSYNTANTVYSGYTSVSNSGTGNIFGFNGFGIAKGSIDKVWVLGGFFHGKQESTDDPFTPTIIEGTVTNLEGIHAMTSGIGTGPVTNNTPIDVMGTLSAGTTTTARGIYIRDFGGTGTVANVYGIYLDQQTKGTDTYQIYSVGGKSYFGGNVGIGTTNPLSKLAVNGLPNSAPDTSGTKGILCITNDGNIWVDDDGTYDCQ